MYFCFNASQIPTITYMNRNSTSGSWKHFSRTAEEYIMYLVHEGVMYLTEDGTRYELHSGDMLLLQPGLTHAGYQESFCDFSYIHFPKTAFAAFRCAEDVTIEQIMVDNRNLLFTCNPFNNEQYEKTRLFIPKQIHIDDPNCWHNIWQCMEAAIHALDRRSNYFKLECSCKAIEILIQLSSAFSAQLLRSNGLGSPVLRNNRKVQSTLALLHSEYASKLSGDDIAIRLEMNFDYLNRLFKKELGMTIFEYRNVIRINKAKEFLINGNMKSFEIAAAVGFCDEYRFCKAFKKMVGTTPGKYHLV